MAKIGRNELCPCLSGKKYKHCHGSNDRDHMERESGKILARGAASRVQRERQQGLGKPIISAALGDHRLVLVKNRLLGSKSWRTFHDFLCAYIKVAVGQDWGSAEIAKPLEERHPILVWHHLLCEYQRTFFKESDNKVQEAPMTGAVAAYMHLAYDLYALDHNAELQEKLLKRLRNHDKFTGARYEVYVAATFIRAGFDIDFENEDDGNTTHCEFTATYRRTGKRFSVEAKRREGERLRIGRLFNGALSKHANHERVIFIDVNTLDDGTGNEPLYLEKVLRQLRSFEGRPLNGQPRPAGYVFVTNSPWDLYLNAPAPRATVVAEGFQLPTFNRGFVAQSLRHIIDAREAEIEMHALLQSIKDHHEIPSTFDGEIPAYAFNPSLERVMVGQRYMVKDHDGVERLGEVTGASVLEEQQAVYFGVTFEDGPPGICTKPLPKEELAGWRQHPDTFFGVVGQRHTRVDSPLEMYDFFHETCKQTSKKQLLEVMATEPDFEELAKLDQPQLASVQAERLTYAALPIAGFTGPKGKPR
jgi:hypothetical protein